MNKIPQIIHQIWSDISMPLPQDFKLLSETWKEQYPGWEYIFWDEDKMNSFVQDFYPSYWKIYSQFPYDMQRWDAIRYLILYKMGGMYVDFDYESLQPLNSLIENKKCCLGLEPQSHTKIRSKDTEMTISTALMLSIPDHPFMKKVIRSVFVEKNLHQGKMSKTAFILSSAGPWNLTDVYNGLSEDEKKDIYLIPAKYVAPFDSSQIRRAMSGERSDELEEYLNEAYAIHYFTNAWLK